MSLAQNSKIYLFLEPKEEDESLLIKKFVLILFHLTLCDTKIEHCIFNKINNFYNQIVPQVRESWQSYELDLINYQNKCKIIRGWDDLFNKVKEHINSVAAMKLSPYYKVNNFKKNSGIFYLR